MLSHSAVAAGGFARALPDDTSTLRRLIRRSLALAAFALGAWLLGAMFAAGHASAAPSHQQPSHQQPALAAPLKTITHALPAKTTTRKPVVAGVVTTARATLAHATAPAAHTARTVASTVTGGLARGVRTTVRPVLKTSPLPNTSRPAPTDGAAVRSASAAVHHAEPAAYHAPVAGSARVTDEVVTLSGSKLWHTVPAVPAVPVGPHTPNPNAPAPTGSLNSFSQLGAVDISAVPTLRTRSIPTTACGTDRLPGLRASRPAVFPD